MAAPLVWDVAFFVIPCYWLKAKNLRGLETESPKGRAIHRN